MGSSVAGPALTSPTVVIGGCNGSHSPSGYDLAVTFPYCEGTKPATHMQHLQHLELAGQWQLLVTYV